MRGHAEGTHLARTRTLQRRTEEAAASLASAPKRSSLRRRGAIFGFRRSEGSDTTISSYMTDSTIAVPITIKQKVRHAVSDVPDLETAMDDIKEIARSTNSPSDFLEILEAILESLLSSDSDRHWSQVFRVSSQTQFRRVVLSKLCLQALVLLRHCVAHVSSDLVLHLEDNPLAIALLRDFKQLGYDGLFAERAFQSPRAEEKTALADGPTGGSTAAGRDVTFEKVTLNESYVSPSCTTSADVLSLTCFRLPVITTICSTASRRLNMISCLRSIA